MATERDYWNMLGYQQCDPSSKLDCAMWLLQQAIEEWEPPRKIEYEEVDWMKNGF